MVKPIMVKPTCSGKTYSKMNVSKPKCKTKNTFCFKIAMFSYNI